jgi:thiol-disulfide isomerase/thioredoxin
MLCVAGCVAMSANANAGEQTQAPSFTVRGLDGRVIRSTDFRGRPMLLDFWATWCVPCRASMPHLDVIQSRYREQGLIVLGVSVDDEPAPAVRRYADRLGVRSRLAMASENVLGDYGPIRSIPTMFFIDRRGQIVRRVVGYLDQETLEGSTDELLK